MKKLFIIGGMGAGKSTARKALVEQGLPNIDLDQVGHDVLLWDTVKSELVETFGEDILAPTARSTAARWPPSVREPGRDAQAQPHHAAAHRRSVHRRVAELEAEGHKAVVWSIPCSRTARRRSLTTPTW